ncbi:MAG: N-acetylmuramoyl-L-alanine amidase [Anaerolineae bacterium]|nr:N-acetylmuramoyl-L-alanine amidase [Anaerolineae bacterium]
MARHAGGHTSSTYEEGSGAALGVWRLVVVLSCVTAIGAMFYGLMGAQQPAGPVQDTAPPPLLFTATPTVPPPTATPSEIPPAASPPTPTPTPGPPHVGIVAGHWGHDTGAMCPDGLREVDINFDVAERVVRILRANGYQVDMLEEFDDRLRNYQADALVSIHADSCNEFRNATPPASGFKVARVANSMVPEAEDRLVACLRKHYEARTYMYFHANSITPDMSHYHTFYEINGQTPGAIIETGFMFADRTMLTERPDLVAQGIIEGIVCFIEGETP